MFKCFNLNANILPKHFDIHYYCTRNNNKFIAPKCNIRKSEMSVNLKINIKFGTSFQLIFVHRTL